MRVFHIQFARDSKIASILTLPKNGRGQKAEGRRQKAEGKRQKAKGRRQKAEGRRQNKAM
jgi:hypothetical protein